MVDMVSPGVRDKHPSRHTNVRVPYITEYVVDWAKVLEAKGSAIAATDVIEIGIIPAGSVVLGGYAVTTEGADANALSVDFGYEGTANAFADGVDGTDEGDTDSSSVWGLFDDTTVLTVTVEALTGTVTEGKMRVGVLLSDASEAMAVGIAPLEGYDQQ